MQKRWEPFLLVIRSMRGRLVGSSLRKVGSGKAAFRAVTGCTTMVLTSLCCLQAALGEDADCPEYDYQAPYDPTEEDLPYKNPSADESLTKVNSEST